MTANFLDPSSWQMAFAVGNRATPAPPHRPGRAQLRHRAPTRSVLATSGVSLRLVARDTAPVTRFPGSARHVLCWYSTRSPPFAPPAPPPVARLYSLASLLLWRFAAPWLAYALPYRRFADTLAGASARLGADAVRYSFTVGDFHLPLFAGFDRRTRSQDLRFPEGMTVTEAQRPRCRRVT
jgi:hypothetical protein